MTQKKGSSTVAFSLVLIGVAILSSIVVAVSLWTGQFNNVAIATPTPTSNITTYHMGNTLLQQGTNTFYWHGILSPYVTSGVIGHTDTLGGSSDIFFTLNTSSTFYLLNHQYKVISYDAYAGTITLEELK
jgi:hypothetical protein